MRGRIILTICGVLLAGAFIAMLAAFGLPPLFVASWILVVLAIGLATRLAGGDDGRSWPPAPPQRTQNSEVSRLAWAINSSTDIVGPALIRRARAIVAHRLAIHGLDLDDDADHPQIDAVLGADIREILAARVMRRDDLDHILDTIENLSTTRERT